MAIVQPLMPCPPQKKHWLSIWLYHCPSFHKKHRVSTENHLYCSKLSPDNVTNWHHGNSKLERDCTQDRLERLYSSGVLIATLQEFLETLRQVTASISLEPREDSRA